MKQIVLNVPETLAQQMESEFKALIKKFGASEQPASDGNKDRVFDISLPITERVKSFDDACRLAEGKTAAEWLAENETNKMEAHLLAYLKLCVIAKALRNGWKPVYDGEMTRFFPWFAIWTKDEIDNMSDSDKEEWQLVPLPAGVGGAYSGSTLGVSVLYSNYVVSNSNADCGGALASEKSEIARHFGAAFLDIWVDYITGNEEMSLPYPEKKEGGQDE